MNDAVFAPRPHPKREPTVDSLAEAWVCGKPILNMGKMNEAGESDRPFIFFM